MSETSITAAELDIHMQIILPEEHHREQHKGAIVELVDYTRTDEYYGDVYAYADADTGEYMGMLNISLLPEGETTEFNIME